MATYEASQLLNITELNNKLSGENTGEEIMNASEIISEWGDGVYIVGGLTGEVIPNNSKIWPQQVLKFGSSKTEAYESGINKVVHFKNTSWDSSDVFEISTSCYIYYSSDVASGAGFYLDILNGNSSSGYTAYQTSSTGKITEITTFVPHYFNWSSSCTLLDDYLLAELPTDGSYYYYEYETNETIRTSSLYISKYKVSIEGNPSSSAPTYAQYNIYINNSTKTVRLKRTAIDEGYPFLVISIQGYHDTTSNVKYHGILVVPPDSYWFLNTSTMTVGCLAHTSESADSSVSTNMGDYTLSENSDWVSINNDNTLNILGNNTYEDRSTTINVSAQVNTTFSNIDASLDEVSYQSLIHTASFTLTQEGQEKPILGVVLFPLHAMHTVYLVDANNLNSIEYNALQQLLMEAPESILTGQITIRTGLNQSDAPDLLNYVEYTASSITINRESNEGFIQWSQQKDENNNAIYYENGDIQYGNITLADTCSNVAVQGSLPSVSWYNTVPSGWQLYSTLLIK